VIVLPFPIEDSDWVEVNPNETLVLSLEDIFPSTHFEEL
jgi:hypothetical protein